MTDYTASYNGLTFGAGTNVQILDATGIDDLAPIRSTDVARPRDTGEFAGTDLASGRDVTFTIQITDGGTPGVNDFATTLEAIKAATVPQGSTTTLPLTFGFPGRSNRILYARPRGRASKLDANYQVKFAQGTLAFHGVDPRWYDATPFTTSISAPAATTGMAFPLTFDLSFGGGGSGGTFNCTNAGNWETRPVAVISGPCTNPSLTNTNTGQKLLFNITLASTDTLTVDFSARTVTLNGTANRYNTLAPNPQWWTLAKGTTAVQFNTASSSGSCQLAFRSAWL